MADNAFDTIHTYNQRNFPMTAGCCKTAGTPLPGKTETLGRHGIISGHAYTLLDTAVVNGTQIIKMRNPWDSESYNGPWSDSDTEKWTPENR